MGVVFLGLLLLQTSWALCGFLKVPFEKSYGLYSDSFNSNVKDKNTAHFANESLYNRYTFYTLELEIGTPAQTVNLLLDTGSSDLWVPGVNDPYCDRTFRFQDLPDADAAAVDKKSNTCTNYGVFNISNSSTFGSNHTNFSISYVDSSVATGIWGHDILHFEGHDFNATFAVANFSNATIGILGVGLPGLETTFTNSGDGKPYQYANFPILLKNAGIIERTVYALHLANNQSTNGSLLFGAIDSNKYSGQLQTVPLLTTNGFSQPNQFQITLQGVGIVQDHWRTTITNTKIAALLDSGTTLSYVPSELALLVARQLGAGYSRKLGNYVLHCPDETDTREIVFDFSGVHITIPARELAVPIGDGMCSLGLVPQDVSSAVLGDIFLKHAYVVYDLDNKEVSLAQANFEAQESIQVVSNTIPGAVKAPQYSQTWVSAESVTSGGNIFATYSSNLVT